jgi:transcriptional regulator with XRE-family HTH domain
MTLVTGNQLKAARALAGIDQKQLADAAGVNVNTVRYMEARGSGLITSSAVTIRKVQLALEGLEIEFLNHSHPGVRLNNSTRDSVKKAKPGAHPARGKAAKAIPKK